MKILVSIVSVILLELGRLIIRLTYGREGWRAAVALDRVTDGVAFLLTTGSISWVFDLVFIIKGIGDGSGISAIMIIWGILFPALYTLWAVFARTRTVPALIEEAKPVFERLEEAKKKSEMQANSQIVAAEAAKANGWTCTCGRTNAAYVSSCVCGVTKQEAKEAAQR